MKYIKLFETFQEKIGDTITFVAKHKQRGFDYGSGFITKKVDNTGKWLGNIECQEGTEITGEIISMPTPGPIQLYKLKLPDETFVNIDLDFFNKKSQ